MKCVFNNELYLKLQSEKILNRVNQFGDKLYLEFGGKLFDDFHASRVLPGFLPDSKLRMLLTLKDKVEVIITINANDIQKNKIRSDLNISYESEVLRLIDPYGELPHWGEQASSQGSQHPMTDGQSGIKSWSSHPIGSEGPSHLENSPQGLFWPLRRLCWT